MSLHYTSQPCSSRRNMRDGEEVQEQNGKKKLACSGRSRKNIRDARNADDRFVVEHQKSNPAPLEAKGAAHGTTEVVPS